MSAIGSSDTGVGERRIAVEAVFENSVVVDYLKSGLVIPLSLRLSNTINAQQYFFQITNIEYQTGGSRVNYAAGRFGDIEVSFAKGQSEVTVKFEYITQGIGLGSNEEIRLELLMDWSLLCNCNGSYSATSVIGEHKVNSSS